MQENDASNTVIGEVTELPEVGRALGEAATATWFVDYYRTVLVRKAAGVGTHGLHQTVASSSLTLARLLRHMAYVEDHWFHVTLAGNDEPELWAGADWESQPDWEMDTAADFTAIELLDQFNQAVARSRAAIGAGPNFDRIAQKPSRGKPVNLRWIMTHMVEEYARHCGHADLIREHIDGRTGD